MTARDQLLEEIRRGQLIVVAGTGVSTNISNGAGASSWFGLLEDGVQRVQHIDQNTGDLLALRLEQASSVDDLTGVAKDIKRHLAENFGRWISRTVGDLDVVNEDLAHAIAALRSPILTTNYDTLLERALNRDSVSWTNPSSMRTLIMNRETPIGHLHGIHSDSSNVIFTDEDYRTIVDSKSAQQIQDAAFTMSTFLFIGVGEGLGDPNFDPMVKRLSTGFPDSPGTHFRLCLNSEVDPRTDLGSVRDVGFGDSHADLANFIEQLVNDANIDDLDLAAKSRSQIIESLRDNTTLWREASSLEEKGFNDLVVAPSFLPEPHNEYSNNYVVKHDKDRPIPVNIEDAIRAGGTIIIAGEENSGVTTALSFILFRALQLRTGSHSILVESPQTAGISPVQRCVNRTYREWGVNTDGCADHSEQLILGVDNIIVDGTQKFDRAIADIKSSKAGLKVIAVSQSDAPTVANELSRDGDTGKIIYLGRFSDVEAEALARMLVPERAQEVARDAMTVIRDKNLPRTPFTITLLVELVQSGVTLRSEESEIAVLDQYLDLLIGAEFGRITSTQGMTTRQKRKALETIARKFVELQEDSAPLDQVVVWLTSAFEELGWENFSVRDCLQEMISRRVLAEARENKVRFQRSAYLELMAGLAAKEDEDFRALVFRAPIQLASIVRSYAAMARSDKAVIELVEAEIDRIQKRTPRGNAFKRVRQIEARSELFSDRSELEGEVDQPTEGSDAVVQRDGMTGTYYDDTPDSDSPAFLTAHLDDLSEARVAMLVVDLASRVLRDSDEVPDQKLKSRVLGKILHAWVGFTDLYEMELAGSTEFADVVQEALKMQTESEDVDPKEVERYSAFFTILLPVLLTDAGINYCLSAQSLVTRLAADDLIDSEDGHEVAVVRADALLQSGGRQWINTLSKLSEEAVHSFFCISFFASRVRSKYLTDPTLSPQDRDKVRAFLRRVIDARYTFRSVDHRNSVMNGYENELRQDLLNSGPASIREVTAPR